jgi:hypothetical protein
MKSSKGGFSRSGGSKSGGSRSGGFKLGGFKSGGSRPSPKPSIFKAPQSPKPQMKFEPKSPMKFGQKPADDHPNMMKDQTGSYGQQGFWQRRYGPGRGCGCGTIIGALVLGGLCLVVVVAVLFGTQILNTLGSLFGFS